MFEEPLLFNLWHFLSKWKLSIGEVANVQFQVARLSSFNSLPSFLSLNHGLILFSVIYWTFCLNVIDCISNVDGHSKYLKKFSYLKRSQWILKTLLIHIRFHVVPAIQELFSFLFILYFWNINISIIGPNNMDYYISNKIWVSILRPVSQFYKVCLNIDN